MISADHEVWNQAIGLGRHSSSQPSLANASWSPGSTPRRGVAGGTPRLGRTVPCSSAVESRAGDLAGCALYRADPRPWTVCAFQQVSGVRGSGGECLRARQPHDRQISGLCRAFGSSEARQTILLMDSPRRVRGREPEREPATGSQDSVTDLDLAVRAQARCWFPGPGEGVDGRAARARRVA